jgi:hypothetical protein
VIYFSLQSYCKQEAFLTPGWIEQFHRNVYGAPVLMIDANLSSQTLEFACRSNYL